MYMFKEGYKVGVNWSVSPQVFKAMRLPQIRDPSSSPVDSLPESYRAKVRVPLLYIYITILVSYTIVYLSLLCRLRW